MPEVTARARRSKEEIAAERARLEARRVERAAELAQREERTAVIRAEMAVRAYEARLEHERIRAGQRKIQEAGIDWLMGYDTPAARIFAEWVKGEEMAVKVAARRAALAGDPTNITGHTALPSKKEQKKKAEADRLAKGLRYEVIPDPEHPNQNVVVESKRNKKPLEQAHHLTGLDRFWKDVHAIAGSLRSPAFDDKVDSSGMPNLLPPNLRARSRIDLCKLTIGKANWRYAVGYLLMEMTPTELHRRGGAQHTTNSARIREALDELCAFYDKAFRHQNRTLEILDDVVERGMKVILDGEHSLNWPHRAKGSR